MTDPQVLSKHVDHIPVIWVEPENLPEPARLVIWLDGLTGHKERMKPYLVNLATAGFVALSFDAFQHGERATERPEQFIIGRSSVKRSWIPQESLIGQSPI